MRVGSTNHLFAPGVSPGWLPGLFALGVLDDQGGVEAHGGYSRTLHVLNPRSTFKVHTPVFCGSLLFKARAHPYLWTLIMQGPHTTPLKMM